MDAAISPLLDADRRDVPATLVRVLELSGFGLRDATEAAVVLDGSVRGRLLAGLADQAVLEAGQAGRRVVRTTVTDRSADAAGLVCGGVATLVLDAVADLPGELFTWLHEARPVALASPAAEDPAGGCDGGPGALAVTDRASAGTLGRPAWDEAAVAAGRELLAAGRSDRRIVEVDGIRILVTASVPRPRVLLVGSGPMAGAIDDQSALLGWAVTRSEDRAEAEAFLAGAGPADAVVVLSHDPALDTAVLARALASDVGYVGAMGSRATQSSRRQRLTASGTSEADQARIHGPIGLDLGARSPAETAVAIVAEILAERSGRAPASLRAVAGPING